MNGFTGFEWTYRRPPGRFVQNKNDASKLSYPYLDRADNQIGQFVES